MFRVGEYPSATTANRMSQGGNADSRALEKLCDTEIFGINLEGP
jgi:hypothetical protein